MRKQKFKIYLLLSLLLVLAAPAIPQELAATSHCPGQPNIKPGEACTLQNPAPGQLVSVTNFGQFLKDIIVYFLYFAGAIAVIFLMVGGFQYIASRGNEEATERAKRTITAAIIGIVVIVMSFAIVTIINTLLTEPPPGTGK